MEKIHMFCVDNSICYYLAYGTLIGAIRHNGFIPWDDDIDIFMPRNDYEKFCALFPSFQSQFGLTLVNHATKPFYGRPMSKVIDNSTVLFEPAYKYDDPIGVFVDIWVLDGASNSVKTAKRIKRKVSNLVSILTYCNTKTSFCRSTKQKLLTIVFGLRKPVPLIEKITMLCKRNDFQQSRFVISAYDHRGCIYKNEWFGKPVLHKFEEYSFYVPNNSDEILSNLYGNWRELPPEKERIPHHVMNAYLKD